MSKVWLDGKITSAGKARIDITTHALHYGTSVFEGIRFYDTGRGCAVFRLPEHVRRFLYSARVLNMKFPWTAAQLERAVVRTVSESGYRSGYIRPLAFYGEGSLGLSPKNMPVHVAVLVLPWGKYAGKDSLSLAVPDIRRIAPDATDHRAKMGGQYINLILAYRQALSRGGDQALLLDESGNIAEAAGANIFIVRRNKLITPSAGSILPGITRDTVMRVAGDAGLKAIEKKLTPPDVAGADECFLTGTAMEIIPVVKLNGERIGSGVAGPVTARLQNFYADIVLGKVKKYRKWLTEVR